MYGAEIPDRSGARADERVWFVVFAGAAGKDTFADRTLVISRDSAAFGQPPTVDPAGSRDGGRRTNACGCHTGLENVGSTNLYMNPHLVTGGFLPDLDKPVRCA